MPKMETWRLYTSVLEREREMQTALDNAQAWQDTDVVAELDRLRLANRKLVAERQTVHTKIQASADASTGRETILYLEVQQLRAANEKLRLDLIAEKTSADKKELVRLQKANKTLAAGKRHALTRASEVEKNCDSALSKAKARVEALEREMAELTTQIRALERELAEAKTLSLEPPLWNATSTWQLRGPQVGRSDSLVLESGAGKGATRLIAGGSSAPSSPLTSPEKS